MITGISGSRSGLGASEPAAGIDPIAVIDAINEAQAQRAAARAELEGAPAPTLVTDAEVYAMVDSLGDVGAALKDVYTDSLERLYRELRLELRYQPHEREVGVAGAVPWRRSSRPAGVTESADQYCTCATGAPAACRDGR